MPGLRSSTRLHMLGMVLCLLRMCSATPGGGSGMHPPLTFMLTPVNGLQNRQSIHLVIQAFGLIYVIIVCLT